jgi:radical SAM protein with 4Fe4S-binding SPASM domain
MHLTNKCNIRCAHCYFYSPHADTPNRLEVRRARREQRPAPSAPEVEAEQEVQADAELLHRLIDEAAGLGARRFQFSGYGEPFCHPDCLELMRHARELGGTCHVDTNGTLLDGPTVDALIDMGFNELRVTTLAGTAEDYARTHPRMAPGGFEELRSRLRALTARKREQGAEAPFMRLVCIVYAGNAGSLADFARFACEVGADSVAFRPFDGVDDPGLERLVPDAEEAEQARLGLAEAETLLDRQGVPHNIDRFRLVFRKRLDTEPVYRTVPCYYGWFVLRVDPDGTVYPCCRCYTPLGNVTDAGIEAAWRSAPYRRFRTEGLELARRGTPVTGCDCWSCVHYDTNISVYRLLHPLKARSLRADLTRRGGRC